MVSGPSPANVEAIRYLQSQGYSARQIERELGIGGSGRLVKYAAESKPAANLTPALTALADRVRGRDVAPVPVERRRTSAGDVARVRRGIVNTVAGEQQLSVTSGRSVVLRRLIADAASWGGRVSAVVTFKGVRKYAPPLWFRPGDVTLWEKGGWDAYTVQALTGTDARWAALALRKPGVEEIEMPILDIQVTIS